MKVIDLVNMIYEGKIPSNIKIKFNDYTYNIDTLLTDYQFTYIMNKYVSIIYAGGENNE